MPRVSPAFLTDKELMHNDRLTYLKLTHSVFEGKFAYYLTSDIMKHGSSPQPYATIKEDVAQ